MALLPLPMLIELKLASGMTAPHRLKDLADVQELIRAARLPRELADELDPYVRRNTSSSGEPSSSAQGPSSSVVVARLQEVYPRGPHEIDHAVLLRETPGPGPSGQVLERLRFANAREGVPQDGLDQVERS